MQIAYLLLAAAATQAAAPHAGMTASCPEFLTGKAVTVHAPDGWRGTSPEKIRLVAAGMMAGPPESHADLIPFKQRRIKNGTATTWIFDGGEKWLVCQYGSHAVQIAKRLSDFAAQCTVSHTEISDPAKTAAEVECTSKEWRP